METVDLIIKLTSLVGAVAALGGIAIAVIKWFIKQDKQTDDIADLRHQHSDDIKEIKEELCVLNYGMLASLNGLKQLKCNGEVTDAYEHLRKHINKKAHDQI